MKDLIKLTDFYLFTFQATSHALKAEKALKESKVEFIVIPTLREISTSCGLSIKIRPDNYELVKLILLDNKIVIDGVYIVKKQGRENLIVKE